MSVDIDTMTPADWEQVLAIYLAGIASGQATFGTEADRSPDAAQIRVQMGMIDLEQGNLAEARAELGATTEFPLLPVLPPALLALADGTVFQGCSIGAPGQTVGETELDFLVAMASHPDYVGPFAGDPDTGWSSIGALRRGEAVTVLRRGVPLGGFVRDDSGAPIASASVTLGANSAYGGALGTFW